MHEGPQWKDITRPELVDAGPARPDPALPLGWKPRWPGARHTASRRPVREIRASLIGPISPLLG